MIRYSRACGSYQDFLDRGLLLTRKLMNQGFLLIKLKSSLRKFCGRHHGYVALVVNTSRSFPHSRLITGFVTRLTRQMPLVKQELPTLPDHLSLPSVFSGVVLLDLQFYVYVLQIVVCLFVLFLLAIVFSILRYTDSDYHFGIFKLFCNIPHTRGTHICSVLVQPSNTLSGGYPQQLRLQVPWELHSLYKI